MPTIIINGFGKIGQTFLSTAMRRPVFSGCRFVVNDVSGDRRLNETKGKLSNRIGTYACPDFNSIPIEEIKGENPLCVIEASSVGLYRQREYLLQWLHRGVDHVIIADEGAGLDFTAIPGVNENELDYSKHRLISASSPVANMVAPLFRSLLSKYGINRLTASISPPQTDTSIDWLDLVSSALRRKFAFAHLPGANSLQKDAIFASLTIDFMAPVMIEDLNAFLEQQARVAQGIIAISKEGLTSANLVAEPFSLFPTVIDLSQTTNKVTGYVNQLVRLTESLMAHYATSDNAI